MDNIPNILGSFASFLFELLHEIECAIVDAECREVIDGYPPQFCVVGNINTIA
jgi:hypothetical protein